MGKWQKRLEGWSVIDKLELKMLEEVEFQVVRPRVYLSMEISD